jgi:hypothetical protein
MGGNKCGGTFVERERMKTSDVNDRENAKIREKKREKMMNEAPRQRGGARCTCSFPTFFFFTSSEIGTCGWWWWYR